MGVPEQIAAVDGILERLRGASWKERDGIRDELHALVGGSDAQDALQEHLAEVKKALPLELRWEVEEILEALAPEPEPEPEPEEDEDDPNRPLTAADLDMVYDDPRGLILYRSKKGGRWFATQADPRTGQPQTFELHPEEVSRLKQQLAGSPYWVLGTGEAPSQ